MEEKSKIKHKPLLFIFTLALMLIIVHSIKAYNSPDAKIRRYIYKHTMTITYEVPEINSDEDTYRAILEAGTWYRDNYKGIKAWYDECGNQLSIDGYELRDYISALSEEKRNLEDELDDKMDTYMDSILDNSSEAFQSNKRAIKDQIKKVLPFSVGGATDKYKEGDYAVMFGDASQIGGNIDENIILMAFYKLYPDETIEGSKEYVKMSEDININDRLDRFKRVEAFNESLGITDNQLNTKLDSAKKEFDNYIPYVGMPEWSLDSTSLGVAICTSYPLIYGEENDYYWDDYKGKTIFRATCKDSKVVSVTDLRSNSSSNSSGNSSYNSNSTSKKKTETTEFDPDDHDIELYYDDFKDEFEDEDDAWDDFEDNEDYWDDY